MTFRIGWHLYSNGFFAEAVVCMNICAMEYRNYVASSPALADLAKARKKLQVRNHSHLYHAYIFQHTPVFGSDSFSIFLLSRQDKDVEQQWGSLYGRFGWFRW